jgi:MoaA/NifB/PqqE/SkfB family radical SAM enzyme
MMLDSLPVLILNPYSRCNCRCKMCDIWKTTDAQELSIAVLERQLASIERLQVGWVVLSGGEPLMHPRIWRLVELLRARQIRVTLLSSGLLLGRHAASIVENVDDVIVSLDGPGEIHDAIRGVPGAFQITAAGISSLFKLDASFRITARCTVQRANFRFLRDTVDAARQLRLNAISFLAADTDSAAFARPNGWPTERKAAIALQPEDIADLEAEIGALIARRECGGFVSESPAKLHRIARHFRAILGETPVAPPCNAPWKSAVVEADGTVRPCFFQRPIGHLNSGRQLHQILNDPEAVAFRDSLDVATNDICKKCVCSLNWRES